MVLKIQIAIPLATPSYYSACIESSGMKAFFVFVFHLIASTLRLELVFNIVWEKGCLFL
jgi:hypothetical protein